MSAFFTFFDILYKKCKYVEKRTFV